jgi:hypothetical protein
MHSVLTSFRVSKKYERSGYNGKLVYTRDTTLPSEQVHEYVTRMKDLEKKFKESRALLVSMQEAKTTDTTSLSRTGKMSRVSPVAASARSLDIGIAALRNQIDLRAALLRQQSSFHIQHGMMNHTNSPQASAPVFHNAPESYLYKRRCASGLLGGSLSPDTGFVGGSSSAKLLLNLRQLQQPSANATLWAAVAQSGHSAAVKPSYTLNQTSFIGEARLAESNQNKRRIVQDEFASLESAYKRARAA